ncbi:MAG: HU family DNA-binding protein [Akkermansia sp.]|nr:HU family DNA-binding protein [Akkermansia sp.]
MNRQGLQELVRQQLGGTATPMAAQLALDAVLRAIADGLAEDGEVKLSRFGTFRVKQRAPRRLLLPGSEKSLVLPSRSTITFHSRQEKA